MGGVSDLTTFADLTTFHLGGRPKAVARCTSAEEIAAEVKRLDDAHQPLLIVGGGSNLVVADGDLDLVAAVVANKGITYLDDATVRIAAGETWDDVVADTIEHGLGGLECLSGIPGSAGATPVQNVGAYGAEIADVLTRVQLYDRTTGETSWVPADALELSYRYSNLKFTNRAVVLAIEVQLYDDGLSRPLRFGALAGETGQRRDAAAVREDVLNLRRGKGMVLDESDHDTWSAGSFFTNPVVPAELANAVRTKVSAEDAESMPAWPVGDDQVKLSAAWLIQRAGFPKGYPGEGARARLSTKHTLALTNRGNATTADLVDLARTIRNGVRDAFGVELVPEPVWVGVTLPKV